MVYLTANTTHLGSKLKPAIVESIKKIPNCSTKLDTYAEG